MPAQDTLHHETIAYAIAVGTGALGAFLATLGLQGLGGFLLAICTLALFVVVIPGFTVKLGLSAQIVPAASLLILGLWTMAGVGGSLSWLSALGLVVGIATVLMPFVLIRLGGRMDPSEVRSGDASDTPQT